MWKISQRIGLDSKTWTFCFFQTWFKELDLFWWPQTWSFFWNYDAFFFLKKWLKELDPTFWLKELIFLYDSKNRTLFCMTQRIEPFLYDLKNWTFLWIWRRELNLLLMRRKELNFFFFASKNWTFFLLYRKYLSSFFWKNKLTQRIELFFLIWLKELKSKKNCLKESNFFWLIELNLFFFQKTMIQRIELCVKKTQRIEIFFFEKWRKELNSL